MQSLYKEQDENTNEVREKMIRITQNFILNKSNNILRLFTNSLSTSSTCLKADDRKYLISTTPKKDTGTEGEKTIEIDELIQKG